MNPGNSFWLPWTSSERALAAPLSAIHIGSGDQAKGPQVSLTFAEQLAAISPRCWRTHRQRQRIFSIFPTYSMK
jgi:hypothetical protein